jgi:hypothetical protein
MILLLRERRGILAATARPQRRRNPNDIMRQSGRVTQMHFDAAFTHRGYLLNCAPARASDGTWQPYVVISRSSDGELVANRFFPTEARFTDEAAAIAHARDWAVRWIDASSIAV